MRPFAKHTQAVAKRSREAAIALFAHGCDLNAKTRAEGVDWLVVEPGSTPLHMCAAAAELDMAQLLLKYFVSFEFEIQIAFLW